MADMYYSVYLVDDDDEDLKFFTDALSELEMNTHTVTFSNGPELMAQLENTSKELPSVIVVDLNLPMMSGEQCCKKIRSNSRYDSIPIIAYSTSLVQQQADRLKALGANLFFQKPSSFSSLKSILKLSFSKVIKLDESANTDIDFILKEQQ